MGLCPRSVFDSVRLSPALNSAAGHRPAVLLATSPTIFSRSHLLSFRWTQAPRIRGGCFRRPCKCNHRQIGPARRRGASADEAFERLRDHCLQLVAQRGMRTLASQRVQHVWNATATPCEASGEFHRARSGIVGHGVQCVDTIEQQRGCVTRQYATAARREHTERRGAGPLFCDDRICPAHNLVKTPPHLAVSDGVCRMTMSLSARARAGVGRQTGGPADGLPDIARGQSG